MSRAFVLISRSQIRTLFPTYGHECENQAGGEEQVFPQTVSQRYILAISALQTQILTPRPTQVVEIPEYLRRSAFAHVSPQAVQTLKVAFMHID